MSLKEEKPVTIYEAAFESISCYLGNIPLYCTVRLVMVKCYIKVFFFFETPEVVVLLYSSLVGVVS